MKKKLNIKPISSIEKPKLYCVPQKLNQYGERQNVSSLCQNIKRLNNISHHDVVLLSSKVGMHTSFIPNFY